MESQEVLEKPLDKYTIENLRKRKYAPSEIVLDEQVETTDYFNSYNFHFQSDGKKVTGLAHIPVKPNQKYPVIVQFRGYVDQKTYESGIGTKRSSEVFAKNGFVTLAPDFLGYGGSASPSADVFESRFETYTTAANLLASVSTLPQADAEKIGIWGHSNGGHIALTVLEITGKPYPTTLWAPVTKPFPYSILFYTDEYDDFGKMLRKHLAEFEADYDADLYSLHKYFDYIEAPLQLHQGNSDIEVPKMWSDEFAELFKNIGKPVTYYVYPGADHNLSGAWDTVVSRDIAFFQKHLQ